MYIIIKILFYARVVLDKQLGILIRKATDQPYNLRKLIFLLNKVLKSIRN